MSPLPINRNKCRRRLRAACTGLLLMAVGASLSACGEQAAGDYEDPATAGHYEPAKLEPIKGTDVKRVTFTAEGARRTGLQTAQVRRDGQQKVIPYAAVIYDHEGHTFTYTVPEPLTFVRKHIKIARVDGNRVVLSEGPPVGTDIVTVGAAEVYGTEFEVAH